LFALELLPRLPPHVRHVWVGDGRLRDEFLARADALGVRGRLHWDGWRADARARMAGFDAFLLPSRYEGLPLALLEGMAAGLPCVASDVDATREAVADGETGWLCPPGDADAWADRLARLASDEESRLRAGRAGLRRYREQFSLEAMARGTAAVYEQALAAAPAAGGRR
jgi:glycosyltransferase involved in cell wall biosynthesis